MLNQPHQFVLTGRSKLQASHIGQCRRYLVFLTAFANRRSLPKESLLSFVRQGMLVYTQLIMNMLIRIRLAAVPVIPREPSQAR